MKQDRIIKFKLWEAYMNHKDAIFPVEFYAREEVEQGIETFDRRNVSVTISDGITDKGFDALIVTSKRIHV